MNRELGLARNQRGLAERRSQIKHFSVDAVLVKKPRFLGHPKERVARRRARITDAQLLGRGQAAHPDKYNDQDDE